MTPLAAGLIGLLGVGDVPRTPACACPCPPSAPAPQGRRASDPSAALVPRPSPAAFALNRQGRDLYRQRRFAEARQRYQAALQSDPTFVAPRLNIACAFTQEGRFGEAVAEAAALADLRYVPWGREIEQAADLAPLQARPEAAALRAALEKAAAGWGGTLASRADSLLFVARTGPPVRLPAAGVLVLGLAQEIFAYLPATGTHRQLTAEDGRVLAFVRSPDGRAVVYVTGGKLLRTPGQPDRLRGLFVRRLDLPRMALGRPVPLEGDLTRVGLRFADQASLHLQAADGSARVLLFDGTTLVTVPAPAARRLGAPTVVLDARGVTPGHTVHHTGTCAFSARDSKGAGAQGDHPVVQIEAPRGRRFTLAGPEGAGLAGLRFP